MQKLLISLITLASLSMSACSIDQLRVYKIDVQQGNALEQQDVERIRAGMTKRQVIFVMGTPLIRDPFHQDRWDYVYNFQPGGGVRGQERVSVFFVEDALVNFTGDFSPTSETTDQASTI